ncbi:MAG: YbaN family protein [Hyphomicrobiaceae bacterium]|nr:YbaN family protein [Hyphomicrobiaceae bacterium]
MSEQKLISNTARLVYLALGWLFFGIGVIGAFLPVLPTTPFMILALWAFSNSSERLRGWLYNHKLFGPPLQRWQEYRVIPVSAKMASIGAMSVSFVYMAFFTDLGWPWLLTTGVLMAYGAYYVLTKPSRTPSSRKNED